MRDHWATLFVTSMLIGEMVPGTAVALVAEFNPHEIVQQQPTAICQECHVKKPVIYRKSSGMGIRPDWKDYKLDGTAICIQCHDLEAEEHAVGGAVIDFPVPADLPLTGENTLMCMTCHYMHGSLESARPWASVSFMDRLTGSERLRKSYVLRRNNSDGELCLVCHDTKGEKQDE
jgi:hypothetical protein